MDGAAQHVHAVGTKENQKVHQRKQDKWAIHDLFATDDDWRAALAAAKDYIPCVQAFRGRLGESADTLLAFFRLDDEISLAFDARIRELGGDIITVGSDAHNVRAAGVGIREGFELLAGCGFRYVAVYRRHKPEFKRIEL